MLSLFLTQTLCLAALSLFDLRIHARTRLRALLLWIHHPLMLCLLCILNTTEKYERLECLRINLFLSHCLPAVGKGYPLFSQCGGSIKVLVEIKYIWALIGNVISWPNKIKTYSRSSSVVRTDAIAYCIIRVSSLNVVKHT